MAASFPADPLGETFEVQVRWSGDKRWYTEENGKGHWSAAESWAQELFNANDDIQVKIVRVMREEVKTLSKGSYDGQ